MNNPLIWGPESLGESLDCGCSWHQALPTTLATCWGQKYSWSEDQSLPKQIHPVGWQMDRCRKRTVHLWEFWRCSFPAQKYHVWQAHVLSWFWVGRSPTRAVHMLADYACREVGEWSGPGSPGGLGDTPISWPGSRSWWGPL